MPCAPAANDFTTFYAQTRRAWRSRSSAPTA